MRDQWAEKLLAGDRLALARAITWVENEDERGLSLLQEVFPHTGKAWVIGLTGAPGAGKSTLLLRLAEAFSKEDLKVGVVAVDPSSPFTGGALLGDRVRWQRRIAGDIFFRSLASRGRLGGLSRAAYDAIRLMDAAGRQVILVETVGVGQAEVDIMHAAHTVVVVLAPGLGDDIQANKAGIAEIGDIFVVHKADREGASDTARDMRMALGLSPEARGRREGYTPPEEGGPAWFPPVFLVSSLSGKERGLETLMTGLYQHRRYLEARGLFGERVTEEDRRRMEEVLSEEALRWVMERAKEDGTLEEVLEALKRKDVDPRTAARRILGGIGEEKRVP
ncbi:MAG: methylmalonyl Co-A mutase-associated GTPase MeaB [Bacillota bacterium]|nr:methylmalonyl Co-A mutase-associated GTPase MeaB [Bacillota bacterium]